MMSLHRVRADRRRRAAATAMVCVVTGLVAAEGASATVAPPAPVPPVSALLSAPPAASPAPVPKGVDQGAVALEYYAKQFGLSDAEAQRHLELQGKVDDLGTRLIDRLGAGFTQVFFDNENGRYIVALSPDGDEQQARATMRDLGLGDIGVQRRAYGHVELDAELKAVSKRLEALSKTGAAQVALTKYGVEVRVSAGATARQRDDVDEAVKQSKVKPQVRNSARGTLAGEPAIRCWSRYCDTLVGGDTYRTKNGECTMAFYAGPADRFDPFMLTAGHCINPPPAGGVSWDSCRPGGSPCVYAGYEQSHFYGGTQGDNGLLRIVNTASWPIAPGWWNWQHNNRVAITHTSLPVLEETLCQGGSVTGIACGTVSSTNADHTNGPTSSGWPTIFRSGMIEVRNMCVNPGDSGGPVTIWHGAYAEGIVSGVSAYLPNCNAQLAYIDPIGRAQAQNGVLVYGT